MYIKWDTTCKVFLNCKIACKYTLLLLAYFCWIINLIGWWLCYVYDILFYIIIQVQSLCWCVLERMCWWYLERGKRRKYTAFGCQNRIFIVMICIKQFLSWGKWLKYSMLLFILMEDLASTERTFFKKTKVISSSKMKLYIYYSQML